MRLGLRSREAFPILLLTSVVVITATLIHLAQLTRVVVQDVTDQADLLARQIYAQSRRVLARARTGDPRATLRADPDLRSLLEASVGYSPHLLYVLIADRDGRAIVHSEREKEGARVPERPGLGQVVSLGPIRRFQALSRGDATYEATLPVTLNGRPFGSIRLGIAGALLGREVRASVQQGLLLAAVALPVSWLIAMALANAVVAELRAMSLVDELTGLYNRRGFLLLAQQQLKLADRMKRGVLLLFADLDGLKQINDTYGHHEGDLALIDAATILKASFRESDILARVGGDEFAIIAVEAQTEGVEILTARLQQRLDAHNAHAQRPYPLSISIGVARYDPDVPCTIDELMAQADRSMSARKHDRHRA
jgi:diguanylate cyclase (GGDEF)-like protein